MKDSLPKPPEGLVQLSTLPRESWKGREVYHPMCQLGDEPFWREVDYPEIVRSEDDTSEEWRYDRGIVQSFIRGDELFKNPAWSDHWRVFFLTDETTFEYDSTNLWTPK